MYVAFSDELIKIALNTRMIAEVADDVVPMAFNKIRKANPDFHIEAPEWWTGKHEKPKSPAPKRIPAGADQTQRE